MSYKDRFQKTNFAKGWIDVIDSPQFQAAADAAMLEFHSKFGSAPDMGTAAACEWKRQGARDFLKILSELTVNPIQPDKKVHQNLDHKH